MHFLLLFVHIYRDKYIYIQIHVFIFIFLVKSIHLSLEINGKMGENEQGRYSTHDQTGKKNDEGKVIYGVFILMKKRRCILCIQNNIFVIGLELLRLG